jgi:aspartate oxidase
VFVIDRGQAGAESFDPLKAELYKAITSLGPQREFQVVFWTASRAEDPDTFAYPKGGTARGNDSRVGSLKKHLEDVTTAGSTEVGPAIREAMSRGPDAVVITTAKAGFSLDDSFVKAVDDARAGKPVVVHTVDLTTGGDARTVLEAVAKAAGGRYVHVPPTKLR